MHRIGIYPAAFDPVHSGHIAFARAAMETFSLDKVYFLPEPEPRHKQGVKAFVHRSNMVHLAIANMPEFGVISLDTQEFDIRYVWPTITARFLGSQLFMLVGNTPVRRLASWPHTTEFGRVAPTFIVADRSKDPISPAIDELLKTKKLDLSYKVLPPDYETHNNSYIRSQLKLGKQPRAVSFEVYEYIMRNKLYRSH